MVLVGWSVLESGILLYFTCMLGAPAPLKNHRFFLVISSQKNAVYGSSSFANLRLRQCKARSRKPLRSSGKALKQNGEGGIRTLGTLLRYNAFSKAHHGTDNWLDR